MIEQNNLITNPVEYDLWAQASMKEERDQRIKEKKEDKIRFIQIMTTHEDIEKEPYNWYYSLKVEGETRRVVFAKEDFGYFEIHDCKECLNHKAELLDLVAIRECYKNQELKDSASGAAIFVKSAVFDEANDKTGGFIKELMNSNCSELRELGEFANNLFSNEKIRIYETAYLNKDIIPFEIYHQERIGI